MESDVKQITEKVKKESDFANTLMFEMGKVIVGQKYLIERLLIGILSNGHVLLEGVRDWQKHYRLRPWPRQCRQVFKGYNSRRICFRLI